MGKALGLIPSARKNNLRKREKEKRQGRRESYAGDLSYGAEYGLRWLSHYYSMFCTVSSKLVHPTSSPVLRAFPLLSALLVH
jgi:hypothetical protein